MDNIEYINSLFADSIKTKQQALEILLNPINQASKIALQSLTTGGKIMACGNGGSAADAQHFAAELLGRFEIDRPGIAALALTTDTSTITAVANDNHFDVVFSRQIEALGNSGDILLAISTSGNSKNIHLAIEAAHKLDIQVIALSGKGGGNMSKLLTTDNPTTRKDVHICVPSNSTARIQEVHILVLHCLCGLIENTLNS